MSTKLTFNIDLTKYDLSEYEKNPFVTLNFDYAVPPIGKATIAPDRKNVEVELADGIYPIAKVVKEKYEHFTIAPALFNSNENKTLIYLAMVLK